MKTPPAGGVFRRRSAPYLPSRSESPGTARSTASLTRFQASLVACLARSHSSEEPPRIVFQRLDSSGSTSSQSRPAYVPYELTPDGKVQLSPASPLNPLPTEPQRADGPR